MKKFATIEELAKAVTDVAGSFTKNADFHKAAAAHHSAAAAHHESHAAFHKTQHEAMDDGHEMKAHVGKVHEHHVAKAAHHKAMATAHSAHADGATKLAAAFGDDAPIKKGETTTSDTAAPNGIEGMVAETTKGLVSKSLEMLQTDPTVQDEIRKMVLEGVKAALGDKIVPNPAVAVTPTNAMDHLRLVPRAGSAAPIEKAQVAPENEEMFAV